MGVQDWVLGEAGGDVIQSQLILCAVKLSTSSSRFCQGLALADTLSYFSCFFVLSLLKKKWIFGKYFLFGKVSLLLFCTFCAFSKFFAKSTKKDEKVRKVNRGYS